MRYESNSEQLEFNDSLMWTMKKLVGKTKSKKAKKRAKRAIKDILQRNKTVKLGDQYGYGVAKELRAGSDIGLSNRDQERLQFILMERRLAQAYFPKGDQRGGYRSGFQGYQQPFRSERGPAPRYPGYFRGGYGGSSSSRGRNTPGPKPTDQCRICKQFGHWTKGCPQNRNGDN